MTDLCMVDRREQSCASRDLEGLKKALGRQLLLDSYISFAGLHHFGNWMDGDIAVLCISTSEPQEPRVMLTRMGTV